MGQITCRRTMRAAGCRVEPSTNSKQRWWGLRFSKTANYASPHFPSLRARRRCLEVIDISDILTTLLAEFQPRR